MTIGEIAKLTGLSESTLRYYEKKGLLKVEKNQMIERNYQESDIASISHLSVA